MKKEQAEKRLEEIRAEIRKESISYGELVELQALKNFIEPEDIELREAAGIPEDTLGNLFESVDKTYKRLKQYP